MEAYGAFASALLTCFGRARLAALAIYIMQACAPSQDSVLKDVERNYTASGFLDTNTFQVLCALAPSGDRLQTCRDRLLAALLEYKANYNREAYQRRTHSEFLPFIDKDQIARDEELQVRQFYEKLMAGRTRLVYEQQTESGFEGTFRLRARDLIYRVQRGE